MAADVIPPPPDHFTSFYYKFLTQFFSVSNHLLFFLCGKLLTHSMRRLAKEKRKKERKKETEHWGNGKTQGNRLCSACLLTESELCGHGLQVLLQLSPVLQDWSSDRLQ